LRGFDCGRKKYCILVFIVFVMCWVFTLFIHRHYHHSHHDHHLYHKCSCSGLQLLLAAARAFKHIWSVRKEEKSLSNTIHPVESLWLLRTYAKWCCLYLVPEESWSSIQSITIYNICYICYLVTWLFVIMVKNTSDLSAHCEKD